MTNTLFVANIATLKKELRLTGVSDTASDAHAAIEQAVLRARIEMNTRLGASLVAELLAITYSANPSTDNEYRRALANMIEIELVRARLLDILPVIFKDSAGSAQEDWNESGVFRVASAEESRRRPPLAADLEFVNRAISTLTGEDDVPDDLTFTSQRGCEDVKAVPRLRQWFLHGRQL